VSSDATSIQIEWDPAYDDGGAPIKEYQVEFDKVVGDGLSNIDEWQQVSVTNILKYTAINLEPVHKYRFRVRTISSYRDSPS
jgi:hypothetical protein